MKQTVTLGTLALLALAATTLALGQQSSPSPGPAGAPAASPTPAYNFVYRATPAPNTTPFPGPGAPEIDEIDLSDAAVAPPANVRLRVLTSDAVTSVTATTLGQGLNVPKRANGVFTLEVSIPDIPSFYRNRSYDVSFVAAVSDGRTSSVTLPLVLK